MNEHQCIDCQEIIKNADLKRCWDCYFKLYPTAIGVIDDLVAANPDGKRKKNKMSEQEKIEAEPKKSIYTLDFDLMLRRADGERFRTKGELLDELNSLLARAEKAEAERDELRNAEADKYEIEVPDPIDWERVRIDAAIAAMQGHIHHRGSYAHPEVCVWAVKHADALVAELKKEVGK